MPDAERTIQIVNDTGLHARPCHALVSLALEFESELRIRYAGREVNGKSILELMTLNAAKEARVEVTARGADAERLVDAIAQLIARGFDESY